MCEAAAHDQGVSCGPGFQAPDITNNIEDFQGKLTQLMNQAPLTNTITTITTSGWVQPHYPPCCPCCRQCPCCGRPYYAPAYPVWQYYPNGINYC